MGGRVVACSLSCPRRRQPPYRSSSLLCVHPLCPTLHLSLFPIRGYNPTHAQVPPLRVRRADIVKEAQYAIRQRLHAQARCVLLHCVAVFRPSPPHYSVISPRFGPCYFHPGFELYAPRLAERPRCSVAFHTYFCAPPRFCPAVSAPQAARGTMAVPHFSAEGASVSAAEKAYSHASRVFALRFAPLPAAALFDGSGFFLRHSSAALLRPLAKKTENKRFYARCCPPTFPSRFSSQFSGFSPPAQPAACSSRTSSRETSRSCGARSRK